MSESYSSDEESEGRKRRGDGMSEFDNMNGEATLKGETIMEHDYATSNSNLKSSTRWGTREKGASVCDYGLQSRIEWGWRHSAAKECGFGNG